MSVSKTLRLKLVSTSLLRQGLSSFYNVIIPFLSIQFYGKVVWGEFVSFYLYLFFATFIITWGNRGFLLRKFSEQPKEITREFNESLATRALILLLFLLLNVFLFKGPEALWLSICLFAFYLSTSFDVFVVYQKEFGRAVLYDTLSFAVLLLIFFLLGTQANVLSLLIIFSLYQLIRAFFYLWRYHGYLNFSYFKPHFTQLSQSWVFALMTLFGFWGFKVDVLMVERLTDPVTTAEYQIINGLLVFLMSVAALIITPFTKNLYRGSAQFIQSIKRTMLLIGVVLPLLALPLIGLLLFYWLNIELSWLFYLLAYAFVFPSYWYVVDVMQLLRKKQDWIVLLISLITSFINLVCSCLFLMMDWGIEGALLGGVVAQWISTGLFRLKLNVLHLKSKPAE